MRDNADIQRPRETHDYRRSRWCYPASSVNKSVQITKGTPDMSDIILGSPQQIQIVQRANALWKILQDDPRFAFQGRTVSLAGEQRNTAEIVISLCKLQGYASCHFVAKPNAEEYLAAYQAAGLAPAMWEQFWGRSNALTRSQEFLRGYEPPEGLSLRTVTPETSDETILRICEMSLEAGVLPSPGSAMRGAGPKGVYSYVESAKGQIVAAGGAFMAYHPKSPRADEAFWGMLATDAASRGKRLACWVGAQVIHDMAKKFGAGGFSSGVKPDNPASQAMCSRLGVGPSKFVYVGATDPAIMGKASVTR